MSGQCAPQPLYSGPGVVACYALCVAEQFTVAYSTVRAGSTLTGTCPNIPESVHARLLD